MNTRTDLVQSLSDTDLCRTLLGLVQNKPLAHACVMELVSRWQRDKAQAVPVARLDAACAALDEVLAEPTTKPQRLVAPRQLTAAHEAAF